MVLRNEIMFFIWKIRKLTNLVAIWRFQHAHISGCSILTVVASCLSKQPGNSDAHRHILYVILYKLREHAHRA